MLLTTLALCLPAGSINAQSAFFYPQIGNALSNTAIAIKNAGGVISLVQCYNPNSSQIYVQIFGTAAANVTVGTTKPIISVPIAATSTGGFAMAPSGIIIGGTAMAAAATTTATGGAAPAIAPDCNFGYQ